MDFIAGKYDIIVVGAGHAGCEAALAAARLGMKTLILSINLDSIANMPCNPNIGGTGKGHLVREVDALGGEMGKAADRTMIQSKTLNRAKGPAVYSLRAQIDRRMYQQYMKMALEEQENLDTRQGEVTELLLEAIDKNRKKVLGVKVHTGTVFLGQAVILATGTYLKARIIIGEFSLNSGPDGLFPANMLSDSLAGAGIALQRFKTGTPARINGKSVDFSALVEQPGDDVIMPFSFETEKIDIEQISCWLTHTNEKTHDILRENLSRSPLFSGVIKGVGARYCPSIEDKVVRFPDRKSHQAFLEPMGRNTHEKYLQGMSSSMPEDVQDRFIRTMPGLAGARIMRSAYAIEYDCIDPTQLRLSLEFLDIEGLFSAGQINGSSGYEEAAAQGIMAGINAVRKLTGKEPIVIGRSEGYIGVLIDDLVTKGTGEPYRMMTSRAEYRLLLRQDNADMRLTPLGYEVGLVSEARFERFRKRKKLIEDEISRLRATVLPPSEEALRYLEGTGSAKISTGIRLSELLKRPEITYNGLKAVDKGRPVDLPRDVSEQVEISVKYEGFIVRQIQQVEQFKKLESKKIPIDIDYEEINNISVEARQKLSKLRPESIGQASRISGVSPADINVLIIWLAAQGQRTSGGG
ncbi:MAG: tRNA uridine-5-carboxymethylaminomethyl(34) synthesis enzyme MnmG [Synergistaceae bacterium]|nr:tRNA uridine-5-carboxymethylaminomethyl(34) synthesis enzyme MnmG [Synergistaceae bacterium]